MVLTMRTPIRASMCWQSSMVIPGSVSTRSNGIPSAAKVSYTFRCSSEANSGGGVVIISLTLNILPNLLAKGEKCRDNHLEVLDTEGNAHHGDAAEESENQMDDGDFPPAAEYPDDVHDGR